MVVPGIAVSGSVTWRPIPTMYPVRSTGMTTVKRPIENAVVQEKESVPRMLTNRAKGFPFHKSAVHQPSGARSTISMNARTRASISPSTAPTTRLPGTQ